MTQARIIGVLAVVVVFSSNGSVSAYRYLDGTYEYGFRHGGPSSGWPWNCLDSGTGPFNYDGTSALSDGVVSIEDGVVKHETAGTTAAWWSTVGHNDRTEWVKLDLGKQVKIDAIATIHDLDHGPSISMAWWICYGSNDGISWDMIVNDKDAQYWGPGTYLRPATVPVGKFLDENGNHTLESVSYRYLRFDMSRAADTQTGGPTDSFAISEIVIDAVPEPAMIVMLLGWASLACCSASRNFATKCLRRGQKNHHAG